MGFRDTLKSIVALAWDVNRDAIADQMSVATDGTAEASKPVVLDATKAVDGMILGSSATGTVGFYGATPVARRASSAQGLVTTTAPLSVAVGGYALSQAQAAALLAGFNEISALLTARGDWKGAA